MSTAQRLANVNEGNEENEMNEDNMKIEELLPPEMYKVAFMVDPYNDKNHFIFGDRDAGKWWKYDYTEQKYIELKHNENKDEFKENQCVHFTIKNTHYAFIAPIKRPYTNCQFHIYKFAQNDQCGEVFSWDGMEKFMYEKEISIIGDVFEKNKIHVLSDKIYHCLTFHEHNRKPGNFHTHTKKNSRLNVCTLNS